MAAPDFTLIRGGQINQSGDDRALFLKTYGGEVFTAFEETNVFGNLTYTRTLTSGKSAQFPSIGGKTASYHVPGTMITGEAANLAETLITVDDFVHSSSAIAEIDQAMAHFDYRQPFSREDGRALARLYDQNIARMVVKTAMDTTSRFNGTSDIYKDKTVGFVENAASSNTDMSVLKASLINAAVNFDEKDVPEEGRNFAVKPLQYALLASDKDTINSELGGIGDASKLVLRKQLHSFNLVKTNNLPTTNVTGTYDNKYDVDARNVVGAAFLPGIVGTVKVRDISTGMTGNDYKVTHNSTLVSSKMLVGHGGLRPELGYVIRTADPAA